MKFENGDLVRILNSWSMGDGRGKLGIVINGGGDREDNDFAKIAYAGAGSPHWIQKKNLLLLCKSSLQEWKDLSGE